MLKVGDKICKFAISYGTDCRRETKEGTVVYIHPQRKFFILEFRCPRDRLVRETFFFKGPND